MSDCELGDDSAAGLEAGLAVPSQGIYYGLVSAILSSWGDDECYECIYGQPSGSGRQAAGSGVTGRQGGQATAAASTGIHITSSINNSISIHINI